MLFDSHAHYDDNRFSEDRDTLLLAMKKEGVGLILNCGSDMPSSRRSIALANKYGFVYAAVGMHPHDSKDLRNEDLLELEKMAKHEKVVAIGEIGLDYYYDHSPRDTQKQAFKEQLELAKRINMPIIVHEREAHADCIEIVKGTGIRGVFHCFSGSVETAKFLVSLGIYISFAGPVTYKNAVKTVEVAKYVPADMFLIETDCPYLSPVPMRGERNSSLNLKFTAQKIAEIRGVTVEEIESLSTENAKRIFGIG